MVYKNHAEQMILFSSKFKTCICGIRSPDALSSAQLLGAVPPDNLNINSFEEFPDRA